MKPLTRTIARYQGGKRWRVESTKTRKFMILDVETGNGTAKDNEPLVYDIGYQVVDSVGNVYSQGSFVIDEIFNGYAEIMDSAYYAKKIPKYTEAIKKGTMQLVTFEHARKKILSDIKNLKVETVLAYNALFDITALNYTTRYLYKSRRLGTTKWGRNYADRFFFDYGTKIACIWHMATKNFMQSEEYIQFCLENGFYSEKGNITTNAETAYRFLINNPTFEEEHTGLEDVKIERKIFQYVLANGGGILPIHRGCWRFPTKFAKENGLVA